jgi:ssDNA-binding Zn-finger/Zn-ribbon topoisomerase 1
MRVRWIGCSQVKNAYRIFIRKLKGKTLLGRSSHRWDKNIKTEYESTGSDKEYSNMVYSCKHCNLLLGNKLVS